MVTAQLFRSLAIVVLLVFISGCSQGDSKSKSNKPPVQKTSSQSSELPILVQLPDFALRDQTGESFGSEQLKDKLWIANFVFTRCPTTCPIQTRNLAKFQKQLKKIPGGEQIELVSITVDPNFDTSAVLADYAKLMQADPERWHFLTGSREDIWDLCKKGFKLAVDDAPPEAPSPIMHSSRMMLVDREGQIRGFYEGTTREGMNELRMALENLLQSEENNPATTN
ncbi:MAG: SCO family protein [Pirellulales bacterium]|nr:SCO family protein [Pirellulales bacterium]